MSIGPTSKYGLIIPKASYINSLVRQGTIKEYAALLRVLNREEEAEALEKERR